MVTLLPGTTFNHACMSTPPYFMYFVYSWNIGPAHIISISTEVYFDLEDGIRLLDNQFNFLKADLKVHVC